MIDENTTLEFYLEHEAETRLEREKFLRGDNVDRTIVPRHIYNSWVRSREYGVNPYLVIQNNNKSIMRDTEQFSKSIDNDYHFMENSLKHFVNNYGIRIAVADASGFPLASYGWENKLPSIYHITEEILGTTSTTVARVEKKICGCFGYQNYKITGCRQFCISNPIFDHETNLIGTATIMLIPERCIEQRKDVMPILELVSTLYRLWHSNNEYANNYVDLLMQALPALSDGVVLTDSTFQVKAKNKLAESMIGAKNQDLSGDKLTRYLDENSMPKDALLRKTKPCISKFSNNFGALYIIKRPKSPPTVSIPTTNIATFTFKDILGEDPSFIQAKHDAFIIAPSNATVLINGDTGTGKELFAQAIHLESLRRDQPFIAINCGAVPNNLIESELFGYEPGSFTGASSEGKGGVLEAASGGTLFLDEVESMPLNVQVKLLRAFSLKYINRIGGFEMIPIDIRVIAATKTNLLQACDEGTFRPDLYYRISTCHICIPPLRERQSDIPILAKHFVNKFGYELGICNIQIANSFLEALFYHDWHGNIRELENVIERALIFMDPENKVLDRSLLDFRLLATSDQNRLEAQHSLQDRVRCGNTDTLEENVEMIILERLIKTDFNIKEAASQLGISRQTLHRKIKNSTNLSMAIKAYRHNRVVSE